MFLDRQKLTFDGSRPSEMHKEIEMSTCLTIIKVWRSKTVACQLFIDTQKECESTKNIIVFSFLTESMSSSKLFLY